MSLNTLISFLSYLSTLTRKRWLFHYGLAERASDLVDSSIPEPNNLNIKQCLFQVIVLTCITDYIASACCNQICWPSSVLVTNISVIYITTFYALWLIIRLHQTILASRTFKASSVSMSWSGHLNRAGKNLWLRNRRRFRSVRCFYYTLVYYSTP